MKYMLMAYVHEAGWPKLTKAEQEQGVAALGNEVFQECSRKPLMLECKTVGR